METDGEFNLHWEDVQIKHSPHHNQSEEMSELEENDQTEYTNMIIKSDQTSEGMIQDTDQMAAENLMYLSQDVVSYTDAVELDPSVECVTEEVITDDWVTPGGQERVEVPMEQLINQMFDTKEENDVDVPLPTDQDEYTAMRPWPCDFCSRRFRKKAALMNHMVAHQNDRPHACNLCGVRYVRKCDLMNHLKVHAFVPDNPDTVDFEDMLENNTILKSKANSMKPKKKRGRRKKVPDHVENESWENMTSARTQQWSRRARSPPPLPPSLPSPQSPPSPASEPDPQPSPPPPADPSRPFVCRHCGVGFAREKALQSHARVHGGDSPMECGECGELCWSREALATHARRRHPDAPPLLAPTLNFQEDTDSEEDMDFRLSPVSGAGVGGGGGGGGERGEGARPPALFCPDCGVAFQRADLLRRHVTAAHSYKRHDSSSSTWGEHRCEVCGETCPDALQLLAHAELHTDRPRPRPAPVAATHRMKKVSRGRNNTTSSNNGRQFPCRECGKVFGSRSSQQIHVRIHTGERPYACRFCWKAFADGGTLRKHERIHTGEKPYACAVCPRAFNQRVVLREHVRSHHSAPDRLAHGGPAYCCAVCGRALPSSAELVQHLIQHCDANTALKRQPQSGPRKYKRRRKVKAESPSWRSPASSPRPRSASPAPPLPHHADDDADAEHVSPVPSPAPSPSPPAVSRPRRKRRQPPPPPPRPRMIHTEEPRPRTKQVRQRRPPRHPADDLRAIRPALRSPSPGAPPPDTGGPYKCEMCALEFTRRDALLLHVPVHI